MNLSRCNSRIGRRGRGFFLALLVGLIACASDLTAATSRRVVPLDPGAPNWNGVWTRVGTLNWDPTLPSDQVDHPKLTPEYEARYEASLAASKSGHPINDPTADCLPQGMPRIMNMVYPMEIFQRAGQVAILAELQSRVRRIYTDGRGHPANLDPTYHGHSIGHWEGRDLVAETVGLRGDMVLTTSGLRLSDALIVKERFHQIGADTLTDTITLIDPKALREPWTVVKTYKRAPKLEIMEYVCQENNRNPVQPDGTTGVLLNKQFGH